MFFLPLQHFQEKIKLEIRSPFTENKPFKKDLSYNLREIMICDMKNKRNAI